MAKHRFQRGDHVRWNSEAGHVSGHITRVVTSEIEFKGYTVHASQAERATRPTTSRCTRARR